MASVPSIASNAVLVASSASASLNGVPKVPRARVCVVVVVF